MILLLGATAAEDFWQRDLLSGSGGVPLPIAVFAGSEVLFGRLRRVSWPAQGALGCRGQTAAAGAGSERHCQKSS